MARQLRIQYEGAIYHLMSRGDRREEIFRDDLDRKSFLQTLGAACQKSGWQVHAYCLMSNHFHLVMETPRANLVEGMRKRKKGSVLFLVFHPVASRRRGWHSERAEKGSGNMKAAFQCVGWEKKGSCFHELRWSRYPQEIQRAVRAG